MTHSDEIILIQALHENSIDNDNRLWQIITDNNRTAILASAVTGNAEQDTLSWVSQYMLPSWEKNQELDLITDETLRLNSRISSYHPGKREPGLKCRDCTG